MLSSDILTEFKDRGDEIRVNPLTYREFYNAFEGEKRHAWREYYTYGGMPLVVSNRFTHQSDKAGEHIPERQTGEDQCKHCKPVSGFLH